MNKNIIISYVFGLVFFVQTSTYSQSKVVLGEEEIRKSPYAKFENKSDQYATPKRKAIEAEIGKGLHTRINETDQPVSYKGFTVQRFYSDEPGKLGGDILIINKNANYGHINSLKRILNSYIQNSFEYTEKNADKLVNEVLYYNAQNRQKLTRIKKRYTKTLVTALNIKKVGIGTKFSDWPGNTQLVIPIKSSSPKPTEISETNTEEIKDKEKNTKPPLTEKEKIKVTKEKVPSTDMPKENISKTNKTPDDKDPNVSDETKITEEKKVIETRKKEDSKTIIVSEESDMKQPEKNKSTTNPSEEKTPPVHNTENKKSDTSDSKVPNDTTKSNLDKKEAKDNTDKPTPVVDNKKDFVKEDSKKVSEQNPPTKTSKDQTKTETKTPKMTEVNKDTTKEESKKTTDQTPPTKVVKVEEKLEEKKTTKDTLKKEDKIVEVVDKTKNPETTKPTKPDDKTVEVVDKTKNPETSKTVKSEEKTVNTKETKQEEPKKDPSKTVALNETKTVTSDKPIVKEAKTVDPPKKVEEPKKDIPKKETVITPPAKTVVEKVPTTKTEIKKMHKELVELKAKEQEKKENSDNVVGEKIVFLKVKEFLAEGHYTSEMWAVDTENDDELFQSPFKKVCGKEFKELDTGVVVMSFRDNDIIKTDTHHLALLDKDSLKLIKQTNEVIFWRSFVKEQGGKIFAVEYKDGKYYLAQFKNDLTFEMRSSDPINPDCEIAFKKNKIYLTKRAGADSSEVSIRVLNRDNLKLRDVKVMK